MVFVFLFLTSFSVIISSCIHVVAKAFFHVLMAEYLEHGPSHPLPKLLQQPQLDFYGPGTPSWQGVMSGDPVDG